MQWIIFTFTCTLICSGCISPARGRVSPRGDLLAPFTEQLRDGQPDDAFAAIYRVSEDHLLWLAAKHAVREDSLTFALIRAAYRTFRFDTVIVEGCPTAWGVNPPRLIDYAEQGAAAARDGVQRRGEIVPAVLGGVANDVALLCGEPDDLDIKDRLQDEGFAETDMLGFYTLRSIPQWLREGRIDSAGDPGIDELLAKELETNRRRLKIRPSVLVDAAQWRDWYRATNKKPLNQSFTTEEAGPLADGPFGSNKLGSAISRARASHLHELVVSRISRRQSVLVVYGASHLMIHRPALDAALGPPCYVGSSVSTEAPGACWTRRSSIPRSLKRTGRRR